MNKKIHLKVVGRFDRQRSQTATLTIDRRSGLVTIRIHRQRRTYTTALATLAEGVVWRTLTAEAAAKRPKRARRLARRGLLRRLA